MKNNKYYEYLELIEAANDMDEKEGKKVLRDLYARLFAKYGEDDPDVERLYNRRRWIYLD